MRTTLSSMRACIDYVARPNNHQSPMKQSHDVDMHLFKLKLSCNANRFKRAQMQTPRRGAPEILDIVQTR
jgi:hypothetical protein